MTKGSVTIHSANDEGDLTITIEPMDDPFCGILVTAGCNKAQLTTEEANALSALLAAVAKYQS